MTKHFRSIVAWGLTVVMATSPAISYAQPPEGKDGGTLSYVTEKAAAAVIIRPRRVLEAPAMEMLPIEVLTAAGKQNLGIDPIDIVEILAIAEAPGEGPPGYGIVVRFSKPYELEKLRLPVNWRLDQSQIANRPYLQSQNPMTPGFYMPDDTTLLIAPHPVLLEMVRNQKMPTPGPLSRLLSKADGNSDALAIVLIEPVRPMLGAVIAQVADDLPPPLQGVTQLPDLIDAAKLDLRVVSSPGASLTLLSPDESKAAELAKLLNNLLDTGEQFALAQVAGEVQGDDPIQVAAAQYTQRITKKLIDAVRPTQSGRVVKIAHDSESNMQVATIGILVALLLPAVQAAREAARRMSSSNNLKQIALAMHNYHSVHGKFPPRASLDDNGQPLLSWRVHLLPYFDQAELYEQFRLDEPWDSDHNSKLIEAMPAIYRNPTSQAPPNLASYLVPVGEGSIFAGAGGIPLRDITDGTANTIMVLEVNDEASVIWTKPDDFSYDAAEPLSGLGKAHPGGFQVSLADGSVHFISSTIDKAVFLRLLMMADGQAVRLD
ncbi:MAG: DUF1559 domain-containing protein [Planctomycetota bacterium]|nr:DUF1559 domain-containing protein [Planctomycetota bacterium]